MPHTKFSIRITQEGGDNTTDGLKANIKGIDKVEYLISPNVGEDLRPLSKIVSGGGAFKNHACAEGDHGKGRQDTCPYL